MPRSTWILAFFLPVLAGSAGAQGAPMCNPGQGGVLACPCGNPPAGLDRGCDNSAGTGGASISATGAPLLSADTLVLNTAGEMPTALSIVLQGTTTVDVVFGQGVRCVGGTLKRLYHQFASGGSITVPPTGGLPISVISSYLGDNISPGTHRFYCVYYRDPVVLGTCPATSTFNLTNGVDVLWQ